MIDLSSESGQIAKYISFSVSEVLIGLYRRLFSLHSSIKSLICSFETLILTNLKFKEISKNFDVKYSVTRVVVKKKNYGIKI